MDYIVTKHNSFQHHYIIHVHHKLTNREVKKYTNVTKRKICPPLVNDLFDNVAGITSILLTPTTIVIGHDPVYSWGKDILPNALEILRINLDLKSTVIKDLTTGDTYMGVNSLLTFSEESNLPALTSPPKKGISR